MLGKYFVINHTTPSKHIQTPSSFTLHEFSVPSIILLMDETGEFRPKFFSMLDLPDQQRYLTLRAALSSHMCRNRRGKRLETFAEMLATIRQFCVRGDENDWRRCLVCGVCWVVNGIAVNTRQLGILIDKCKSSINGSLQKMGYTTLQSRGDSAAAIAEVIPCLKDDFGELREWTVRLFCAQTPQPALPLYNVNTMYGYASPAPHSSHYHAYPANPVPFWDPSSLQQPQPVIPQTEKDKDQFFEDEFCLPPDFMADDDPFSGDVFGL